MSFQPASSGTALWWAPGPPPSHEQPSPPNAAGDGAREGVGMPIAAAVLGGAGLVPAAAGFFLSSNTAVIGVLASAALLGAVAGVVLGAWGVRRPLGELAVVGLIAAGLTLPLGVFELLVAVSGHLG